LARDYDAEHKDLPGRKYAYGFDYILHGYLMRALRPWLRGGRALEMGCYKGEFTRLIEAEFSSVTVVEASQTLIADARSRVGGQVEFIQGVFEEVSLPARFDAIFLIHTLEHLDDPVPVLRRVLGWLSSGGRLFVAVPNANAASRRIAVGMGLIEHNEAVTDSEKAHGHRRTYTMETLRGHLSAAGFRVLEVGGVMFKPLANFQLDRAAQAGIIDDQFYEGCYRVGAAYPDLCATIYAVCEQHPAR
jgi:2-polyprenyl-3-methyl-5-hydroxy-6-metoxy-1,4-benzoquinol methylase